MERCRQCVMPLHLVKHNRQKVCLYCQESKLLGAPNLEEKRKDFHSLIESYKGRGKRYDFLVPLTGGKDSTYVLYYLTRVLGASRVLAFSWDHLFHRQASWANMEKAVAAAGVDFQVYRIIDVETTRAVIRGFYRTFGHTCMCCRVLLVPVIGNVAIRNEIPLVVSGENPGQALARGTHDKPGAISPHQEIVDRLGTISYLLRKALAVEMPERIGEVEEEILGGFRRGLHHRDFTWPHYVDMGAYIDWYQMDENTFLKTLSDAFGFQKGSDTFTHTSCSLERLRGYQEYNFGRISKTGYTGEISQFVRSGVLTREKALLELERLGMTSSLPDESEHYCRETGLMMEEFRRHLGKPFPLSVRAHFGRVIAGQRVRRLWPGKGRSQTKVRL
jgi:hypothetical protein